jgi:hypothetical protein
MKRLLTTLLPIGLIAVIATVALAPTARAASRSPQIGFVTASLQAYLSGLGQSTNVGTDQLDQQVWTTSLSGNASFTLMAEMTGNAALNEVGVYNAADATPTLFPIIPPAALPGWYATVHFGAGGTLSVALFDNSGVFQNSNNYSGVSQSGFGFYIKGPSGTWYSQDSRNGGKAQVLTYAGTGSSFGTWWECFEDAAYNSSSSDFDDSILNLQSVATTPTQNKTWGGVKSDFR